MENCESDIVDIKRKSHASSICLSLLQDGLCAPIESLIDTCPVVPKKFMRKFTKSNNLLKSVKNKAYKK